MKIKDISLRHQIPAVELEQFIEKSKFPYKYSLSGQYSIADEDEARFMDLFREDQRRSRMSEKEKEDEILARKLEEEEQLRRDIIKRRAMAEMLITSGFQFDGYRITKYSGYISGDDVVQINRGREGFFTSATNVGEELMKSLVQIRRNALQELKEAAWELGCNAVIGVDFDYLVLDPETANSNGGTTYLPYVFCVTANGNAVIIEKKEE